MQEQELKIAQTGTSNPVDNTLLHKLYIEFFISSGLKSDSYERAVKESNCGKSLKHCRQMAHKLHSRLLEDIQKALLASTVTDTVKSRLALNRLRDTSENENIVYQVAKHQSNKLYSEDTQAQGITVTVNRDNVQITHKNQTLSIENEVDGGGSKAVGGGDDGVPHA